MTKRKVRRVRAWALTDRYNNQDLWADELGYYRLFKTRQDALKRSDYVYPKAVRVEITILPKRRGK